MQDETPSRTTEPDVDSIREDRYSEEAIEEMTMLPLKHFFDIEPFDQSDEEKLSFMMEWGKENGFKTRGALFRELSKLEGQIGKDPIGERRVSKLFRFMKLNQSIRNLQDERESYLVKR